MPEFIPTELTGNSNDLPITTSESNETKNEEQPVKPKEISFEPINNIITPISNHNPFMKKDNKLPITTHSSTSNYSSEDQENAKTNSSSDDAWQEVINYLLSHVKKFHIMF